MSAPTAGVTTARGVIAYRTPLLSLSQARLVACGMEQIPGIIGVEIIPSKSRGSAWVQWMPADQQERDNLYISLMEKQASKAMEEMARYQFFPTGDGSCAVASLPKKDESREIYVVSGDYSCTCPDYLFRCAACGLFCKHGIAWKVQRSKTGDEVVIEGAVVGGSENNISIDQPTNTPLDAEGFAKAVALDFG